MTRSDFTTPEEVNEVYRRRARFYDWSVNAYYLIGFRWWAYRRRAIAALGLQPGATIVEVGCGTGLNFRLVQESIGLSGRLIGVDLCTDMLKQAYQRVAAKGWSNVELVQARAPDYDFPSSVDAVFSTFALSLEPRFDEVIAKAAMALVAGGRFVLLDLRMPDNWLRNLAPVLVWLVRPFAVSLEVAKRQPWKSLQRHFPQYNYQEGYLGIVYIAVGQQTRTRDVRQTAIANRRAGQVKSTAHPTDGAGTFVTLASIQLAPQAARRSIGPEHNQPPQRCTTIELVGAIAQPIGPVRDCGGRVARFGIGEPRMETLLLVLDLIGAFVFALSGATAGVRHRLDLFGVLVLSYAAGNTGGMARDLLIGAVPPAAISDWRYLAVSLLAGIVTFWRPPAIDRLRSPVLLFDAAGLGLFAVAGAQTAIAFGLNPVVAALLGMLTGIGGGMARDVLLAEIPTVLRSEHYAVAALAGAAVVVIGAAVQLPSTATTIAGAVLCFGLRFMAIRRGWHLPVADGPAQPTTQVRTPNDRKDDGAMRT